MKEPSPSRFRARRNAAVFLVETDQEQEEAEAALAAASAGEDASALGGAGNGGGGATSEGRRRPSRRGRNGYSYQFGWMNNKKFIKQLQKDNIDLAILQSEIGSVNTKRRKKSWKERLLYAIRSNVVQIILCAFVLIDAVIVIAEIILEIKAITSEKHELEEAFVKTAAFVNRTFASHLAQRSLLLPQFSRRLMESPQFTERLATSMSSVLLALSRNTSIACNVTSTTAAVPTTRLRRAAATPATALAHGSNRTAVFANFQQEYSHAKVLHDVSAVLHFVSIGILGLFVLEVAIKIICLGRSFVREKFEIVDAVIIMISFVADIVFVKLESTEVSVMVLFLLWRIVRVINGLMMHEKQRGEFRIQLQKRARRMSEMKCDSLETERDLQEKHILFLEELCRELGGSDEQIANCKPRYVNISKRQSSNALKSMAAMSAGIFGGIAGAQHRRSLSALTNNLSSPPSTSRQSSGLDTIVEDADGRVPPVQPLPPPPQQQHGGEVAEGVELMETAAAATADATHPGGTVATEQPAALMNGHPAGPGDQSPPQQQQQQQHHQGKRSSMLQRQLYVEEEQEAGAAAVGAAAAAAVAADDADDEGDGRCGGAADVRLQDVRVDSGQYTTTGSDSETEEDPWELQEYNYKFC